MKKHFNSILYLLIGAGFLINCNQQKNKAPVNPEAAMKAEQEKLQRRRDSVTASYAALRNLKLANTEDFVCGMSTATSVKDTATYNGKLYGFCNTGCKEDFLADPVSYLKAEKKKAKMK